MNPFLRFVLVVACGLCGLAGLLMSLCGGFGLFVGLTSLPNFDWQLFLLAGSSIAVGWGLFVAFRRIIRRLWK